MKISNPRSAVFAAALGTLAVGCVLAMPAIAEPIAYKRTLKNINVVQAGVSGISAGNGSIVVTGVSGTVKSAYLYWHGVNLSGIGATYNDAAITVNGQSVTGVSQGVASTNCWGNGSSGTYEADVTSLVRGNGTYALTGLARNAGDSANGASMIVAFDDGIAANNRDYVIFAGNDSSHFDSAFPSDAAGWNAVLEGIEYRGGVVRASVHAADGQPFGDSTLTFQTASGTLAIADTTSLWDGVSLRNEGSSRASGQGMYDLHSFDITPAFGGAQGPVTLRATMPAGGDCLAMTSMVFDLEPGAGPFTTCAAQGYKGGQLTMCQKICDSNLTGSALSGMIKLYVAAYREQPACAR